MMNVNTFKEGRITKLRKNTSLLDKWFTVKNTGFSIIKGKP